MKKRFVSFLIIFEVLILSTFFIFPIPILANGDTYYHSLTVGQAGENTEIRFWGTGYVDYYKFITLYNDKTGDQIDNLLTIDKVNPWDLTISNNLAAGNYHYDLIISSEYGAFANEYGLFLFPDAKLVGDEYILDIQLNETHYFTVASNTSTTVVEPVWVRSKPVTCWNVWINEEGDFQFVFLYPFKDNNWVRIYDLDGNMVYETDLPYNNPNLIVDLPDGIYTVKTYHCSDDPIQEFIIGKP